MKEKIHQLFKNRISLLVVVSIIAAGIIGTSTFTKACIPKSYMIKTDNYFDYQQNLECSAYASAYVIRSLGDKADGLELYSRIPNKNEDGTVSPKVLTSFLKSEGYKARIGYGTLTSLKMKVSKGTPVVILVETYPNAEYLHYLPVIGYDEEYFYVCDSLKDFAKEETYYNRKISKKDFMNMWDNWRAHNLYITIGKK